MLLLLCALPLTECTAVQMLAGQYGFVAQLNEGRHLKKRPTEFRVDTVLQPFDAAKFNFTKVDPAEVLFRFEQSEDSRSDYFEHAPVSDSPNVVIINVSANSPQAAFLRPVVSCHPSFVPAWRRACALSACVCAVVDTPCCGCAAGEPH